MNQWILFMLGRVISHHVIVHIKCTLALCQNRVRIPMCHNCCVHCCDTSHMNSWMLFIFGIVTIYHENIMHYRSKFPPCPNRVYWAIFAVVNSLLLEIPTDHNSCRKYTGIAPIENEQKRRQKNCEGQSGGWYSQKMPDMPRNLLSMSLSQLVW